MKKLNPKATQVFCRLLEKLGRKQHLKLTNPGYMPLTIELVNSHIIAEVGEVKLYSLAHYYTLNGDLVTDPEMCFLVFRKEEAALIIPCMYQQGLPPLYQESISIEGDKIILLHIDMQADHTAFANSWLNNIDEQGFLNDIP